MTDVFLSYKREDRDAAKSIAEYLVSEGYDVWWDVDLLPGDRFADEIDAVLSSAACVVVLWTPESIRSDWVKSEAMVGVERKNLIPICLRETRIPVPFNTIHALDFTKWTGDRSSAELSALLAVVNSRFGASKHNKKKRSPEEVDRMLDKPEHEVEFWSSITHSAIQTAEEYELYLEHFGKHGSFAKLANQRIAALRKSRRKPLGLKDTLGVLSAIMALAVGAFTIASYLGVFEGLPDPTIETKINLLENTDRLEDVVDDTQMRTVRQLVQRANSIDLEVVLVVGHAAGPYSEDVLLRLSELRADIVKKALIRYGIEPSRIYTEGKGSSQPIPHDEVFGDRDTGNRVEIEILGNRSYGGEGLERGTGFIFFN